MSIYGNKWLSDNKDPRVDVNYISIQHMRVKSMYNWYLSDGLCYLGLYCAALDPATPGPRLIIKTVLSTYGDFHVKDKTAVRTSYL